MPAASSHDAGTRREPVYWRGHRVPNLWTRQLAGGSTVYEFQGRVAGSKPIRRRLDAESVSGAVRESRRVVAELERRGPLPADATVTVNEAAARWLQYLATFVASGELAERTVRLHAQRVRTRIAPTLGGYRLAKLSTTHVSAFMAELRAVKVGAEQRPLSGATRRGYLSTLEALLTWSVEQRLIPRSPAADLPRRERPSAARQRPPRRLNREQVETLLAKLGGQFRPLGYVLAYEALRVSEALGLRWCDVDFDCGTLTVGGQLLDAARVERTKTPASAATVALLPAVARELRVWRSRQAERDMNLVRPDALIFTTWNGRPQSRRNVHRAVRNAAETAGLHADPKLPKVTTHDLRGSAGSIALPLLSGDLARVGKHLRHANPNVTARLYVDVLEGDAGIGDDLVAGGFGA